MLLRLWRIEVEFFFKYYSDFYQLWSAKANGRYNLWIGMSKTRKKSYPLQLLSQCLSKTSMKRSHKHTKEFTINACGREVQRKGIYMCIYIYLFMCVYIYICIYINIYISDHKSELLKNSSLCSNLFTICDLTRLSIRINKVIRKGETSWQM